jgi:hypothetical protein
VLFRSISGGLQGIRTGSRHRSGNVAVDSDVVGSQKFNGRNVVVPEISLWIISRLSEIGAHLKHGSPGLPSHLQDFLLGLKGVLALGKKGKHGPGGDHKDRVGNHYFDKGEASTAGVQESS